MVPGIGDGHNPRQAQIAKPVSQQRGAHFRRDALAPGRFREYPALHRLEAQGWISAEWQLSDKGKRAKYYNLTRAGRKQLAAEQSKWDQLSAAMARVLKAKAR